MTHVIDPGEPFLNMGRGMELKRHAERYRMDGFPIYGRWEDDMEGEIVGFIDEPVWQWSDLSEDDRSTVMDLATYMRSPRRFRADLTEDQAFVMALDEFGIACPHLRWTYHEPIWRECNACRVTEQLPGRVVTIEGESMRVPDPPPLRLRIPRPLVPTAADFDSSAMPMESTMQVDEYEWRGNRYERLAAPCT